MEGCNPPTSKTHAPPIDDSLAVDFIQNHLPLSHDDFKNLPIRFDGRLKRFVFDPGQAANMPAPFPLARALTAPTTGSKPHPPQSSLPPDSHILTAKKWSPYLPARKLAPALQAMTFWSRILEKAMAEFATDNPDVSNSLTKRPEYSIRGLISWDDVYLKLLNARAQFNGDKSKFASRAKKAYRYLLDKHDVARGALKVIPDQVIISPVKAAVEILLDAASVASSVREKVGSAFDEKDLEHTFGKIELFLATFPNDENILQKSIALIACTLKAVEGTIVYFLSHTFTRFREVLPLPGVGKGKDFRQDLLGCISQIQLKCEELVNEALNSHIEGTKTAMQRALEGIEQVMLLELEIDGNVKTILANNDQIQQQGAVIKITLDQIKEKMVTPAQVEKIVEGVANSTLMLLSQGLKDRDQKDEEERQQRRRRDEEERQERRRRDEEQRQRDEEQRQRDQERLQMDEALNVTLGMHFPQQQFSPGFLMQQMPWQIQHYLHGQHHQQYSFGLQDMAPPIITYQSPLEATVHVSALLEILNASGLETGDTASILNNAGYIDLEYLTYARSITTTPEFHAWATSPTSCKLLVQGDTRRDVTQSSPAFSFVSAALIQGLRKNDRFISLVFFCRQHSESDDHFAGPRVLLRSFITQLLQQRFANCVFLQRFVDLEGLRNKDLGVLCRLFAWLVRQLPQQETLICVVDSIETYENDEYENDLKAVTTSLLSLASDSSLFTTIKVLATSPGGTVSLMEDFSKFDDDSILLMEGVISGGDEEGMQYIEDNL